MRPGSGRDDEPDIRELIDLTLSRMGLAADCAGSVAEAKSCLADTGYQLCLTDMRRPTATASRPSATSPNTTARRRWP